MKRTSIYCFFLLLFSLSVSRIQAQSAVLASGTNVSAGSGSVSYSIGQTVYLYKGPGFQVAEGVQQAYEITTLSTEASSLKQEGIQLYPNPVSDYLYIDFTTESYQGAEYQLFDLQGKLVRKDMITQVKSELNLSSLPSTGYIIRIIRNGEHLKTFKIIKK